MLISQLVTEDGRIFASQDARFHHYFARDTMYTALFIADTYRNMKSPQNEILFKKARRAVKEFWKFQTKEGKIPHEVKPFKGNEDDPLYLCGFYQKEGKYLMHYDSIDATPLALIATAEYFGEQIHEIKKFEPRIIKALLWIIANMDTYHGWLSYFPDFITPKGTICQGWMDSDYGVIDENGKVPSGPIALVEVQALVWKTLKMWAELLPKNTAESLRLLVIADNLREEFHKKFLINVTLSDGKKRKYLAHAIAGGDKKITSISINPGFCLWVKYKQEHFIKTKYTEDIISVITSQSLYHESGGIRTFATHEKTYDPELYHSGKHVFWPFATSIVIQGLLQLGEKYHAKARKIMLANLRGILHFGSFIEHFIISEKGDTYMLNAHGSQANCTNQAWTVASFWWMLHHPVLFEAVKDSLPDFSQ